MKYPWAHFVFGGSHLAWCNACDSAICGWTQRWGDERLPHASRLKIDAHLGEHA